VNTHAECLICFSQHSLRAARRVIDNDAAVEKLLQRVLREASTMDLSEPPPVLMGTVIQPLLRNTTGRKDPFAQIKAESNAMALELLPELEAKLAKTDDPLATAVRLAIAGNIIDFSMYAHVPATEIRKAVQSSLIAPLDMEKLDSFRNAVASARRILYVGDNAGEIVFDRLLIQQIGPSRVVFAVRGGPVINDATMEDAQAAGLTDLVDVIDTGSDIPGIRLDRCSPEFREVFETADCVVAKGQGNYETMEGLPNRSNLFFLFQAKCAVVLPYAGCNLGDHVMIASAGSSR
jgi:hypothetical protein